jgi:hypothetical protein
MRLRAPIIAAALLGSAVMLVWSLSEQPVSTVAVPVSLPPAEPVAAAADTPPASLPAPQERSAGVVSEPPRAPLPGEAATTPLLQLLEDQRPAIQSQLPALGDDFPRHLERAERAFAAEPVDESWALGAQANVLNKISQVNGLALLNLGVECRSTMCRLQMSEPQREGAAPARDIVAAIGLQPQWIMSLAGRGGSVNTVAYLWREGFAPVRPERDLPSDDDRQGR